MAKKEIMETIVLEREYVVPLRKGFLKVPEYKRAAKAVKTLKEFIARHMKIYDRDLRRVKIDVLLNNEIRFRGMKKPPAKIRVKAQKFDVGIVKVFLVDIPSHIKFERLREEKKKEKVKKKVKEKEKSKKVEEKKEETEDTKAKEEASKEETQKLAKEAKKAEKHTSKEKKTVVHRKAMSR